MVISFWTDELYKSWIKKIRFIDADFLEALVDLVCST